MTCLKKALLLSFLISCSAFGQTPSVADVQRAADERIQALSAEVHALKNSKSEAIAPVIPSAQVYACPEPGPGPLPPPQSCAQDCQVRFSSGSCGSYGPDYCGPEAACSANCTVRFSNGSCGSYAADFCGPYASCTPDCKVRFSDGSCGSYGPDVCN